jgi:hypothetical protein
MSSQYPHDPVADRMVHDNHETIEGYEAGYEEDQEEEEEEEYEEDHQEEEEDYEDQDDEEENMNNISSNSTGGTWKEYEFKGNQDFQLSRDVEITQIRVPALSAVHFYARDGTFETFTNTSTSKEVLLPVKYIKNPIYYTVKSLD